ncbi:MAG: PAS domain S-box protein [Actinobacteria bacterium]|nr:PAS domain S-box protein [Actinomycetota bacterium]
MPDGNSLRILIVDDEPDTASMLSLLFKRKFSAHPETALDCNTGRRKIMERDFNLVTLDYQFPDGNGLELLKEITAMENAPPVIMVTGRGDECTAVESFKLGASGYVVKDGKLSVMLYDTVEHVLSKQVLQKTERELRLSEERYRQMFDNMMNGAAVYRAVDNGSDFIFLDLNKAALDLDDIDLSGAIGNRVTRLYPEVIDTGTLDVFRKVWKTGRPEHHAITRYEDNKIQLWREISVYKLPSGEIVAIYEDITEKKKIEEDLERERAFANRALNSIRDTIYIFDPVGRKPLYWNEANERILGYSHEEFAGKDPLDLCDENDHQRLTDAMLAILGGKDSQVEVCLKARDGGTIPFEFVGGLFQSREGEDAICVVGRDITERKNAEAKLLEINNELEGYAHAVSHDLNGSLSGIAMAVDLLGDSPEKLEPKEYREVTNTIRRNVEKALDRVSSLLTLAESGQKPDKLSNVDIRLVVDDILDELFAQIRLDHIKVHIGENLGCIYADPTQIHQLFSNLISNAIKHNDMTNPEVSVQCLDSGEDGTRTYIVKDNGPGIPPGDMDSIFLPFHKGERTGETGLGLVTVDKIVKVYGGRITAYNDNGACFEFTLRDICSPDK